MVHPSMDVQSRLRQGLAEADGDLLRDMVQTMAEVLMGAEARPRPRCKLRCKADSHPCGPRKVDPAHRHPRCDHAAADGQGFHSAFAYQPEFRSTR